MLSSQGQQMVNNKARTELGLSWSQTGFHAPRPALRIWGMLYPFLGYTIIPNTNAFLFLSFSLSREKALERIASLIY